MENFRMNQSTGELSLAKEAPAQGSYPLLVKVK